MDRAYRAEHRRRTPGYVGVRLVLADELEQLISGRTGAIDRACSVGMQLKEKRPTLILGIGVSNHYGFPCLQGAA